MDRILIIDDDVSLCGMLSIYLEGEGIRSSVRHSAESGLTELRAEPYDLVVLDVMLPRAEGFDVLRSIREWSNVSVLLLTARGGQDDRLRGFASGADDYLAKPFHPPELVARIRAVLRRTAVSATRNQKAEVLSSGSISINLRSRTARAQSTILDLTAAEFDLLATLVESTGVVLSRDMLMQRVFSREFHPEDRSLDVIVSRLRRKLEAPAPTFAHIKTVRNAGYLFSPGE